jgi:hypothetical protein
MREVQRQAQVTRREFVDRSKPIIKKAIVDLFIANPHVEAIRFTMDAYQNGHEYSEGSRLWGFKAVIYPDLDNYVEIQDIFDKTLLRDSVGSLAIIFRELRYALIELYGSGTTTFNRSDWIEENVSQIPIQVRCE